MTSTSSTSENNSNFSEFRGSELKNKNGNDGENVADARDLEVPLLPGEQVEKKSHQRLDNFDLFRGFIMIVMAWDHAKDILADTTMHGRESWQGEGPDYNNDSFFFLARFVSDICAPGFFFTMGFGMILFTQSRLNKGWNFIAIQKHFLTRALVIFLVGRMANVEFFMPRLILMLFGEDVRNPITNQTIHTLNVYTLWSLIMSIYEVMTALTMVMAFSSLFIVFPLLTLHRESPRLVKIVCWTIFLLNFVISNSIIVQFQHGHPNHVENKFPELIYKAHTFPQVLVRFLAVPGMIYPSSYLMYPLIPWLGFAVLGMNFALDKKMVEKRAFSFFGLFFLTLFVIVRLYFGSFGNLRGLPRGDGGKNDTEHVNSFIEFLYSCKYPPSFAYALITMGQNFLLLRLFSANYFEKESKLRKMLLVFGRIPLFFYIAHLFFIASFGVTFNLLTQGDFKLKKVGFTVFIWIPLIALLFPICQRYEAFKNKKPIDSWWRML